MVWKRRYGTVAVRFYTALIDPLLWPLRPKIVRICRESGLRVVLDIGCATGAQCRALGRAGIRATGLDLSEAMIAAARRRDGRLVDYVLGSAYDIPAGVATYDGVLLLLAVHEHTEAERTRMLREAQRILRPGGTLVVADYAEPRWPRFHLPWRVIRGIEAAAGREHRSGFREFLAAGSLGGWMGRHALTPERWERSHFGTIAIAVLHRE